MILLPWTRKSLRWSEPKQPCHQPRVRTGERSNRMKKVLAAVATSAGRTELAEFDMPEIPPEAGLLKLEAAGVCGSDWVCREAEAGIGTTVFIQGPGQQGLGCVIAAREAGAGCIIVSGLSVDKNRLELARNLGAHHTIDAERQNLSERIAEITASRMADLVIDTSS